MFRFLSSGNFSKSCFTMIYFLLISRTVLCHASDFSRYKREYVTIWAILICLGIPMAFDVMNTENVNFNWGTLVSEPSSLCILVGRESQYSDHGVMRVAGSSVGSITGSEETCLGREIEELPPEHQPRCMSSNIPFVFYQWALFFFLSLYCFSDVIQGTIGRFSLRIIKCASVVGPSSKLATFLYKGHENTCIRVLSNLKLQQCPR